MARVEPLAKINDMPIQITTSGTNNPIATNFQVSKKSIKTTPLAIIPMPEKMAWMADNCLV